jgi:hypothetical protein
MVVGGIIGIVGWYHGKLGIKGLLIGNIDVIGVIGYPGGTVDVVIVVVTLSACTALYLVLYLYLYLVLLYRLLLTAITWTTSVIFRRWSFAFSTFWHTV